MDEPLYAAFLNQGAVSRPPEYVEKVFAAQSKDAAVVVKEKMATPPKEGLRFNKVGAGCIPIPQHTCDLAWRPTAARPPAAAPQLCSLSRSKSS